MHLQPTCCQEPLFLVTDRRKEKRLEQKMGVAGVAVVGEALQGRQAGCSMLGGRPLPAPGGAAFGPQMEGKQLRPTPRS